MEPEALIEKNVETNNYVVSIYRYHTKPSGNIIPILCRRTSEMDYGKALMLQTKFNLQLKRQSA